MQCGQRDRKRPALLVRTSRISMVDTRNLPIISMISFQVSRTTPNFYYGRPRTRGGETYTKTSLTFPCAKSFALRDSTPCCCNDCAISGRWTMVSYGPLKQTSSPDWRSGTRAPMLFGRFSELSGLRLLRLTYPTLFRQATELR